jgi:hypothetical protein
MPNSNSFAAARKQAEDAGMLGGGDIYKYKEGDNRLRLLSMCLPHPGEYQGRPNFKWLCYVLDRRDGKVKIHFMPHTIYKSIEALQENPDYTFAEVPMPYDVTVYAKGAGTKEVEYTVLPARKEVPLTDAERAEYDKQKSLEDVQKAIKEKVASKDARPEPPPPTDDEHVPF